MNATPHTTTDSVIDLSYLDMMSDGDSSMKKTMLDMLLEEMPPELVKLRAATDEQDAEQLKQVAHKMKSTLTFIGNDAMTNANATLETIGREGTDLARSSAHMDILEREAPAVITALRAESAQLA